MASAKVIRHRMRGRITSDGVVLSQAERVRRTAQAVAADPEGAMRVRVSAAQDEVRYLEKLLNDAQARLDDARASLRQSQQSRAGGSAIWGTSSSLTN